MNGLISYSQRIATANGLLNDVNPLMIRSEDGSLMRFSDLSEMYLYFLRFLRERSPRGYFEPSYIARELYNLSEGSRLMAVRRLRESPRHPGSVWVIYVNWTSLREVDVKVLRTFVVKLHGLLETEFSETDFETAINTFKNEL